MVVSLLTTSPSGPQRPEAEHRFAYPTVRPLPRPTWGRSESARAW